MAIGLGGPAVLRPAGVYSAGSKYQINDVVTYLGSSYVAIAGTTGNLPTNTTYWQQFVAAAQGVPTGGLVNQVLIKKSPTSYDLDWANLSSGSTAVPSPYANQNFVSGYWYDNRLNGATAGSSIAPTTAAIYVPMFLPRDLSVDALGIFVNSAPPASVQVRIGILSADPTTYLPATILASISPTLTTSSSGPVSSTFTAVTIPAGLCWVGVRGGATYFLAGVVPTASRVAVGALSLNSAATGTSMPNQMVGTVGVSMADNPAVTSSTGNIPVIFFRAA